jgi:hypothetical protein
MTTTYSIDTGDGRQLCAGLTGYDTARRVAQRRAGELGETVYLYSPEDALAAEEAGEDYQSEPVAPSAPATERRDPRH